MTELPNTEELLELLDEQDRTIQVLQDRLLQSEQENNLGLIEQQMQEITNLQSENCKLQTQISELLNLSETNKANKLNQEVIRLRKENQKQNTTIEDANRQIEELKANLSNAEQNAREKAQNEVAELKRELSSKIYQADHDKCQAEKYKKEIADQKAEQQKEIEKLADEKAQKRLKMLDNEFKAKKVGLVGYVGLLTVICFSSCILSLIRCEEFFGDVVKFFRTFWKGFSAVLSRLLEHLRVIASYIPSHISHEIGSKIVYWLILIVLIVIIMGLLLMALKWLVSHIYEIGKEKAVNTWNVSIWAIMLVIFVWFGDIVKSFVDFNLLGLWLIFGFAFYLVGWYINKDKW